MSNKSFHPFQLDYGFRKPKVIYYTPRNLPEGSHVILWDSGFIKTAKLVVSKNGEVFTCDESGTNVDKKLGNVNHLSKALKDVNDGIAQQMHQAYKAKYGWNVAGYDCLRPLL